MKKTTLIKNYALYMVMFTLPMYIKLNNILLVVFFALFIVEGDFISKWKNLKENYALITPLFLIFLLALFASLNPLDSWNIKYLEKYWVLLLMPITMFSTQESYQKHWKNLFTALLWGCVATLLICYANVFYEMILGNEPLHYFWRWRHLNHEFTEIADTHPAYLGLFIVISIAFILLESPQKKWVKRGVLVFLILGLIQLASRTALISLIGVLFALLAPKLKSHKKEIMVGVGIFSIVGLLFFNSASTFLKDRLVSLENFENDQRFSRYRISFEIFKEHPIFGVGFANKDEVRISKYIENDFMVAALEKYNAHNQMLEYLSVNGLIGGVSYLLVFAYLWYLAWKKKQSFFLWLLVLFFIANLTESMLVRIKGIEFFAIIVSLLLILKKREEALK
ncbi:MAG: O-antigen ligase family protein [Flavobacteriaceae bacterium]|nr:O-antigen ligase family protein [Flavobacteriaceae bacterium]